MGTSAGLVYYNGGKTNTGGAWACCCPHYCHVDRTVCLQVLLDTKALEILYEECHCS